MYGEANALYWESFESQNYTHLILLKHQNTKIALYKLLKNHWVMALFENIWSVRKKVLVAVLLDHPVFDYLIILIFKNVLVKEITLGNQF